MNIFDYWKLPMNAEHRDQIYENYCNEIRFLKKYFPWMSDSLRRRKAIFDLTEDFKVVLSDLAIAMKDFMEEHDARMDE